MPTLRDRYIHWALAQLGRVTLWGAKGEGRLMPNGYLEPAFDCSGLVTCGYRHVGPVNWTQTHNTDRLWAELPEVLEPEPGDLAFYGGTSPTDVEHVAIVLAGGHVICASGATSKETSIKLAWDNPTHRVLVFNCVDYRRKRDFRGYRRSTPLIETPRPPDAA